jgi:phosphoribosyl-ATP pyrophosphohydrolase/phosphoribosyl-AMP cyclohydrolase
MTTVPWDTLRFDEKGLIPVIVQDALSGKVLMMAWADRAALEETVATGEMVFFSRSRGERWHKGATSGNTQRLRELRADCDGDTLLALVEPAGPACHTGKESCFHNPLWGALSGDPTFLGTLWRYLQKRKNDSPEESYTARLLDKGIPRVAQKIGEEGLETSLAVTLQDREGAVYEASDLLYHLLVGFLALDISLEELWRELASRHAPK